MEQLFIDCCSNSGFDIQLCESTSNGRTKFRGKFQEAEAINKNKRKYPFDVLSENVSRLNESIHARRLVGELDHPADSIIHFANCSHLITKLWWDGNILMGEGEILSTPHGRVLRALIDDGVQVGVSSRGVGSGVTNEDGILVIGESYKLITFDVVADPSTLEAYQKKIIPTNSQRPRSEAADPSRGRVGHFEENSPLKNESQHIYKLNKELLIACIDGLIKSDKNN